MGNAVVKTVLIVGLVLWGPPYLGFFLIKILEISVWAKISIWMSSTLLYNYLIFRLVKEKSAFFAALLSTILFFAAVSFIYDLLESGFFNGRTTGDCDIEVNRFGARAC
jgi:hypothetical protein